jgi:DNA-binding GntR family transcriptional regulator
VYTGLDTPTSRAERAYGELKERLLAGDFALGQRLGEERLAAMIGVSRTPIREAMSRLHVEGFVERLPDGGYCPTAPNLHAIGELYEVRAGLELLALRRPAASGGAHDLATLEPLRDDWRALDDTRADTDGEPGPDPSFVLLDEDFHVRLAESSGNHELAVLLQAINERIRLVRIHDFLSPERIELTIRQHLGIVEAVLDHTVDVAETRLQRHLAESLAVVEQRAAAALARMLATRPQP